MPRAVATNSLAIMMIVMLVNPAPTSVIIRIRRRFRGKHADSRCADKAG
jgi:hypothetical protein